MIRPRARNRQLIVVNIGENSAAHPLPGYVHVGIGVLRAAAGTLLRAITPPGKPGRVVS